MRTRATAVYTESIGEGLTMRSLECENDVERVTAFNVAIHGPDLGPMTRSLLLDYPGMEPEDQVFVENSDGEIVSALCLIPWTWRCDGTPLQAGEMGIVGTSEDYRGRGLIRAQVEYFKRRLRERGCVLSHIQGIGFFYRQFGYQYALPLEGGYRLEFRHIPEVEDEGFIARRASNDDILVLTSMYESAVGELCFATERSPDVWRYLLTRDDPADGMYHDTWIVERHTDEDAQPQGYMRIPHYHFGDELVIDEAYAARHDVALWMLDHAKKLGKERDKPGIRLNLPASSYLTRLAMAHGGAALGTYAWQIHVPDDVALLKAMRPALESRLERSHFTGWTGRLRVSFYTRALSFEFVQGSLCTVEEISPVGKSEVSMPYAAFVPLVTGHNSIDELSAQYPDTSAHGGWKLLLETLFPKSDSFFFTAY